MKHVPDLEMTPELVRAARGFLVAKKNFKECYAEYLDSIPLLSDDKFWELVEYLKKEIDKHWFQRRLINGVEYAIEEFFANVWRDEVCTLQECYSFVITYSKFVCLIHNELNRLTSYDYGKESFADTLPFAGREIFESFLRFNSKDELEDAISSSDVSDQWKELIGGDSEILNNLEKVAKKYIFYLVTWDD